MMDEQNEQPNEETPDLYAVIGADRSMSTAEIKKLWRDWARKNHPDVTGGDHAEFARRSAAAEILCEQERRDLYDATGKARPDPDKIRTSVLAIMQQIINSILNGGDEADTDLRMQDVSLKVLNLLNEKSHGFTEKRQALARRRRRTQMLLKRMKPRRKKAKENDIVKAILTSAIADMDRDEKFLNEAEAIHFAVIEAWADYRYDVGWGPEMDEQAATLARGRLSPPPRRFLGDGDPT